MPIISSEVSASFGTRAALQFPADDSAHPGNAIEYWQWWLHLRARNGRRFGAELVFFSFFDASGQIVRRTDVRLTDLGNGAVHSFSKWYEGPPPPVVANGFSLSSLGQSAVGGGGYDRLHLAIDGYMISARTQGTRHAIPIGGADGVNRLDPLEMLQIYERWRMPTHGTLRVDGRSLRVTGTTWFEHGWGNAFSIATVQWDYFQLQLATGRDILVVQVRRAGGTPNAYWVGAIRTRAGRVTQLRQRDFTITPTGTWQRDSSCTYPSGWIVTIRGQRFVVTPTPRNQEVRSLYGSMWDGETTVSGSTHGRGITELLNYCYAPSPSAQTG